MSNGGQSLAPYSAAHRKTAIEPGTGEGMPGPTANLGAPGPSVGTRHPDAGILLLTDTGRGRRVTNPGDGSAGGSTEQETGCR